MELEHRVKDNSHVDHQFWQDSKTKIEEVEKTKYKEKKEIEIKRKNSSNRLHAIYSKKEEISNNEIFMIP